MTAQAAFPRRGKELRGVVAVETLYAIACPDRFMNASTVQAVDLDAFGQQ